MTWLNGSSPWAPWRVQCSWSTPRDRAVSGRPSCTWCWMYLGGRVCLGWPVPSADWPGPWHTAGSHPARPPGVGLRSWSKAWPVGECGFGWELGRERCSSSVRRRGKMLACLSVWRNCLGLGAMDNSREPRCSQKPSLLSPGQIQRECGGTVQDRAGMEEWAPCLRALCSPVAWTRPAAPCPRDTRGIDEKHQRTTKCLCDCSSGEGRLQLRASVFVQFPS